MGLTQPRGMPQLLSTLRLSGHHTVMKSALTIGDIEIQCYVLEDETRVLTQDGFVKAIGRTGNPKVGHEEFFKTPAFIAVGSLKPFISNDLISSSMPIPFQVTGSGSIWYGYRAILLPKICEVYLKAREAKALRASQLHIVG